MGDYDQYDDEQYDDIINNDDYYADDDDDDFNIEDYADLIDQIDDPTLLQFIFEFGDSHHYEHGHESEEEEVSPAELACAKEHDKDGNGIIDETEMVPFLMCLKGAAGGYDGPDADKSVSAAELKCGMAVDVNH